MRARLVLVGALTIAAVVGLPSPAAAHVTIQGEGEQGGFGVVTFTVPNERPNAGTVRLAVKLPDEYALPFVSAQPKPGWTVETSMRTLDEPVDAFGEQVSEVVDVVEWSGGTINPGEFDAFSLQVGPFPEDADQLVFPTIQYYSNGEEVSWIEETPPGGEEPEFPAPVLPLVAPDDTDATADDSDDEQAAAATQEEEEDEDDGDALAIAALVVGSLALVVALATLVMSRRRTT
jgi:uncharacterized protein YcnI